MSEDNHIEQLEFDLGLPSGETVRISVNAHSNNDEPNSSLAQETLKHVLKEQLTEEEYSRIEVMVRRIDWHIDIIMRDRKIKEDIQQLLDGGQKVYEAVQIVAKRFFISEERVYTIWYGKEISSEADSYP